MHRELEVTSRHLFNIVCKDGERAPLLSQFKEMKHKILRVCFPNWQLFSFFLNKKAFLLVCISEVKQDKGKKLFQKFLVYNHSST